MMQEKLVSVIIPTFNRDIYFIRRAIESVMWQTYKNYEIIVVDDNINKAKYSLKIKRYCRLHNIKYIKTNGKEGANKARNLGALCAKGYYLTFLDDDDILLPNKLKIQIKSFSNDIGMVFSNGYVVSSKSKRLYTCPEEFILKGNIYRLLLYNYIGPTVSALISATCFFDVGMFDENMPSKQDYDLWIRITRNYKVKGINKPLFLYTQHNSHQMTKDYNLILQGYKKLYEKYIEDFSTDFIINFFFCIRIAKIYRYNKKIIEYIKCILYIFKIIYSKSFNTLY